MVRAGVAGPCAASSAHRWNDPATGAAHRHCAV